MWFFTPSELVIKNGYHLHINAEKWSGENLTNLTACYGYAPLPPSLPPLQVVSIVVILLWWSITVMAKAQTIDVVDTGRKRTLA